MGQTVGFCDVFVKLFNYFPRDTHYVFMKFRYNGMYTIKFGGSACVVITDVHLIREALVKNGDALSGRASNFMRTALHTGKCGIIARFAAIEKRINLIDILAMVNYGVTIVVSHSTRCVILVSDEI